MKGVCCDVVSRCPDVSVQVIRAVHLIASSDGNTGVDGSGYIWILYLRNRNNQPNRGVQSWKMVDRYKKEPGGVAPPLTALRRTTWDFTVAAGSRRRAMKKSQSRGYGYYDGTGSGRGGQSKGGARRAAVCLRLG